MSLRVIEPAASADLTTLATAKEELGISGTAQDAAISRAIRQASDAIARHIGQPIGRELVEQTERGLDGWRAVLLDRTLDPVLESISENGEALDLADYELDGARVYRARAEVRCAWWGSSVVIRYRAGFTLLEDLPYDIERAALLTVAQWHSGRGRDPLLRSETTEGVGTVTYATATGGTIGPLPPAAAALLEPYRLMWRG